MNCTNLPIIGPLGPCNGIGISSLNSKSSGKLSLGDPIQKLGMQADENGFNYKRCTREGNTIEPPNSYTGKNWNF